MSPTVLLADPAVRLAGLRAPVRRRRRVASAARRPRVGRLLLGALLAAVVLGLAFLQTWPPLATVMSGSMAPTINTGDVVLLKRLDRPARLGDIVSVSVPEEARARFGYPPVVIHRIVAIGRDGSVSTKGDAYPHPDPFTVPRRALNTRVVATIPAAGRVVAFLGSTLGLLWLVGGGALLLGMPLVERYREAHRRDENERITLQSALEAVTAELERARQARGRVAEAAAAEPERAPAGREGAAPANDREVHAREAHDREVQKLAAELERAREAHDREVQALAAELDRTREARDREVQAARTELRLMTSAFGAHLEQLPAQIERAIADAFAGAAPPPPPPPPVVAPRPRPRPAARFAPAPRPAAAAPPPTRAMAPLPPARVTAPARATPDLFARRFVPASQFVPTPDLLGALKPANAAVPWDAPPSGATSAEIFVA